MNHWSWLFLFCFRQKKMYLIESEWKSTFTFWPGHTHILRSSVGLSRVCLSLKKGTLGNVVCLSLSLCVFCARHSAQCAFAVFCVQWMRTTNRIIVKGCLACLKAHRGRVNPNNGRGERSILAPFLRKRMSPIRTTGVTKTRNGLN